MVLMVEKRRPWRGGLGGLKCQLGHWIAAGAWASSLSKPVSHLEMGVILLNSQGAGGEHNSKMALLTSTPWGHAWWNLLPTSVGRTCDLFPMNKHGRGGRLLSTYVSIYFYLPIFTYLSISICVCICLTPVSVHLSVSVSTSICTHTHTPIYLSIYIRLCPACPHWRSFWLHEVSRRTEEAHMARNCTQPLHLRVTSS